MRFTALYPLHHPTYSEEILDPRYVADFARTAEAVGFDAVGLTEHPAPSARWLDAGGHNALDVFTTLGFMAAVTQTLQLMPYVLVPPFRNPVMAAKQIATLDVLSGGRLIVPVGTGYLRSEADALGVDFAERNELLDEAVGVWRKLWSGCAAITLEGRHFRAGGIRSLPAPVQRPHPPLWVGGNSARARQRVADWGRGWTPILGGEVLARTTRTAPLPDVASLALAVEDLYRRIDKTGRDPAAVDVQLQGAVAILEEAAPAWDRYHDWLDELEAAGVTQLIVEIPADSAARGIDGLRSYGAEVVDRRAGR